MARTKLKLIQPGDLDAKRRIAVEAIGECICQGMNPKQVAERLGRAFDESFLQDWSYANMVILSPYLKMGPDAMATLGDAVRAKIMLENVHGTIEQQRLALTAAGQHSRVRIDIRTKGAAPNQPAPEIHDILIRGLTEHNEREGTTDGKEIGSSGSEAGEG